MIVSQNTQLVLIPGGFSNDDYPAAGGVNKEFGGTSTAASNHSSELSVDRNLAGVFSASMSLTSELSVDRPLAAALSVSTSSFAVLLTTYPGFVSGTWDSFTYANAGDTWQ